MNPFRKLLVQMQVITAALAAGLLVMVVVVITVVVILGKGVAVQVQFVAPNVPLVTTAMGVISVVLFFVAWLVPIVLEQTLVRRLAGRVRLSQDELLAWDDADPAWAERPDANALHQLVQVLHHKTVLRAGVLLALGMLSGMAYLVEAHPASLLLMMLAQGWLFWLLPTRGRVQQWLSAQMDRLRAQQV